jgi:hypothetical protein
MNTLVLFAALLCALQPSTQGPFLTDSPEAQISGLAREAVSELAGEDYGAFFARFDDTMKSAMPAAKLPELWKSITAQVGAFDSQVAIRQERAGSFDVVYVTCRFERMPLDVKLIFNAEQRIAGLFFSPVTSASPQPQGSKESGGDH